MVDMQYFSLLPGYIKGRGIPFQLNILIVISDSTCETMLNSAFCQGIILMIQSEKKKTSLFFDRKILKEFL